MREIDATPLSAPGARSTPDASAEEFIDDGQSGRRPLPPTHHGRETRPAAVRGLIVVGAFLLGRYVGRRH